MSRGSGLAPIILLLAGSVVISLSLLMSILSKRAKLEETIGDGIDPSSYGFELDDFSMDDSTLVASGLGRDALSALVDPPAVAADQVYGRRGLVSKDRVIGVVIAGEARAYPLNILAWHEIVNDELGGVPIAVTWSPLGDAMVVVDRRLNDQVVELGFSGLLHDSNLLAYDQGSETASLWAQLPARFVSGPLNGAVLPVLPASLTTWAEWLQAFPETTVSWPPWDGRYKRRPYDPYFGSDLLRFPVEPLVEDDRSIKRRIVALREPAGEWVSFELEALRGKDTLDFAGRRLGLVTSEFPPGILLRDTEGLEVIVACRFAWLAALDERARLE